MSAWSTKGMTVWLEKKPGSSPTPIAVVDISNANPAQAEVAATDITKFKVGDVITVQGTNTFLDEGTYIAGAVDTLANTVTLTGADASSLPAPVTTGTLTNHAADFAEFCVSTFENTQEAAQSISVATTCDPAAQVAGEPQAGSLSVGGPIDYQSPGFQEFLRAKKDGLPRMLLQKLPATAVPAPNVGEIIYPSVTATGATQTYNVGDAARFTSELTLGEEPVLRISGAPA